MTTSITFYLPVGNRSRVFDHPYHIIKSMAGKLKTRWANYNFFPEKCLPILTLARNRTGAPGSAISKLH